MDEHGVLGGVVAAAGCVMAAGAAIALGWRGRASWEPCEQDIRSGPQKVGSLVASVGIAVLYVSYRDPESAGSLVTLVLGLGAATVAALIAYGLMVGVLVYERVVMNPAAPETATRDERVMVESIIGGFWLTASARQEMARARVESREPRTIQTLLAGRSYDPDLVWDRLPRSLAKQSFVLSYLALTACGTLALAGAAILIDLSSSA